MSNFDLNKQFLDSTSLTSSIKKAVLSDIRDKYNEDNNTNITNEEVYELLTNEEKNSSIELFYEYMSEDKRKLIRAFYLGFVKKLNEIQDKNYQSKIDNFKKQFRYE
jgi:hypothetical protein